MDHTRIDDPTLVSEQSYTNQVQLRQNECYAASKGHKDKTDE